MVETLDGLRFLRAFGAVWPQCDHRALAPEHNLRTRIEVMSAPSVVPLRLSSFIGRRKEMGELRRLLAHTRLLTMLGPGGAGKTRLATEFARAQGHRFADGQVTVELVEVRDPALVPDAFARAAGIRLQAEDTVGTLVHRLISSEMLLV